jgi:Flp pilus assembly protein CpaB
MLIGSPRALMLRIGAGVVAVLTAGLVASDLAELHRRANDLGSPRDAVVATHDLTIGDTVRRDDLRVREIHASQLPPRVIPSTRAAVGRVVAVPVLKGDFLSPRHLAPRHRTGLDGAIPDGMRAMRVVVTEALRPRTGAVVDVLATFESEASLAAAGEIDLSDPSALAEIPIASAVVIADGVLVLSTDRTAATDGGATLGVTLLVSPRQARELAFAATHGVLALALAPPENALG